MTVLDWPRVEQIYAAGIRGGVATFESATPAWTDFDRGHLGGHRFVAAGPDPDAVVGWIAGSPTSQRAVYAGVVEHSIYVDPAAAGRGVGRALLDAYVASTEAAGIWTLQAGLFPENTASVALHRRAGFRVVGTRERIGRIHGVWHDVVLVERRSPRI
jgi:L-amino acid N-acyltransferase YncA